MKFRLAQSLEDIRLVQHLTYDVYLQQQYTHPHPDELLRHYPGLDEIAETSVIMAEDDGLLVGTNSFTLDSGKGLHTDDAFPLETYAVRDGCQWLCLKLAASWRIVTIGEGMCGYRIVLGLIGATHRLVNKHDVDVMLYTFHPKHESFYEKLIGAETIARLESDGSVNGHPAILMRTDRGPLERRWSVVESRRGFLNQFEFDL